MSLKEQFIIPESPLWEYIGDLSQDVLECSYNDDDIRELWCNGTLDDRVRDALDEYPWRLKRYYREDGRYSDQLTAYVVLHRGWAHQWGPEVDPLNTREQAMVNAFLGKHDIVVNEKG